MTHNDTRHKDLHLIIDVLETRASAIMIAIGTSNDALYMAAVSCDDAEILRLLEQTVADVQDELDQLQLSLESNMSMRDHLLVIAEIAQVNTMRRMYVRTRDTAKANVELIKNGEVCYPPALKPTEELIRLAERLRTEMEEKETATA